MSLQSNDRDVFRLASDQPAARARAAALFDAMLPRLIAVLPSSCEVLHVGATAVPGCLTKGDLDIVVRAPFDDFASAETALSRLLARNEGSARTTGFAAFQDDATSPPLGVQLTAIGGTFDDFHRFAERLRSDPALVEAYNALKRRFDGQGMDAYRTAKDAFIADLA